MKADSPGLVYPLLKRVNREVFVVSAEIIGISDRPLRRWRELQHMICPVKFASEVSAWRAVRVIGDRGGAWKATRGLGWSGR